jgi:hypothetical protein
MLRPGNGGRQLAGCRPATRIATIRKTLALIPTWIASYAA